MYGVFDTVDKLWIGNEDGPRLFEDKALAMIAALIADKQLGQEFNRTQAKLFEEQPVRLRDEIDTVVDTKQAIEELEEGR